MNNDRPTFSLDLNENPDSNYEKILQIMELSDPKNFIRGKRLMDSYSKDYWPPNLREQVFFFRGFLS